MAAVVDVDYLVEMFSTLNRSTVVDVVEQCDNNCQVALERLLTMAESPTGSRLAAPPVAPRTRQAAFAMLFPSERRATPLSNPTPDYNNFTAPPAINLTSTFPGNPKGQGSESLEDLCPWLVTLDTGQDWAHNTVPQHASRGWWPSWPAIAGEWAAGGLNLGVRWPYQRHAAANGSFVVHPTSPVPLASTPAKSPCSVPSSSWNEANNLLENYRTPPRTTPSVVGCGTGDELLAAMMPHLAHCLATPSPSGTCSPCQPPTGDVGPDGPRSLLPASRAAARMSGLRPMPELATAAADAEVVAQQTQQGYDPAALVQAVDFHLHMFPNLKREVVGDVLQRYSDAPQTALDQLIMLSSCVEDAAQTMNAASDVPDELAWEAGSGSEEELVGRSWVEALTPAELAAMEQGIFPVGQLAPQAQQVEVPAPQGDGGLPAEEKLAVLKGGFPSIRAEEVVGALEACDGNLFAAAQLLGQFASEDGGSKSGLNGSMAAAAASVPAAATPLPEPMAGGIQSHVPQHARPKVQHLARRFPAVPTETLEVALQSCSYDLVMAQCTLQEVGYKEVDAQPSPSSSRQLESVPAAAAATVPAAPPLPQPVPLPALAVASSQAALPSVPLPPMLPGPVAPAASLTVSEATHLRNQAIFEQERAQAQRLQECYRKCFELASQAHTRGDYAMAEELRRRGHEYRLQYDEERCKASKRISKRVNQATTGQLPLIKVDLHGSYVDEALETVQSGIRNLPESIPGGVIVRYITGKGLHSAGGAARIKPEVLRLLSEQGVPFVEGPGWVEATLVSSS